MNDISIKLSEGLEKKLPQGLSVSSLFAEFGITITNDVLGCRVGESLFDLQTAVTTGGTFKPVYLSEDTQDGRYFYRHSLSHVLAQAVRRLYSNVKLGIGPAIKTGFYYDFQVEKPFTPDDLKTIEAEMKKIIKEGYPFERLDVSVDEAYEMLRDQGEPFKLELLENLRERGEKISFYRDGDFVDMCAGPHVPSTKAVFYFKLLEVAGAYWRGDEKRPMLQRIYATAFLKKEDLKAHLEQIEEAKKRDHRKLAKELDLFSVNEQVGPGLILWHPKGGMIRYVMEDHYKRRHLEAGYDFVHTPHVGKGELWETSGHLDFYREGMYPAMEVEGQTYYMKQMNCPFHVHIYKNKMRSYRELPVRFAEWGTVYRFERSGTLHGATRVRGFTQDDAHIFCTRDQIAAEMDSVMQFSLSLLKDFGLNNFHMYLSTRPEKRVGAESDWDTAEGALREALERSGVSFSVNVGDGAFYGPKIDLCVTDAIGREWQLSTLQFDFNLPERFDLSYIGEDGKEHRPFMLHRALLGSIERFFAILIEHHAGNFPVWLAPTQVVLLPISQVHHEFASALHVQLKKVGLRVEVDASNNTLNYRIRTAQKMKLPFMIILGDKEVESGSLAVRLRTGETREYASVEEFLTFADEVIKLRNAI
jgi:threonyl-tRNA synthetase